MVEPSENIQRLKLWLKESREQLLAVNVTTIIGTYDGSGDEGVFQGVQAADSKGFPVDSYEVPHEISTLLEEVAEELETPGYQNGNGGGGAVELNVDTGLISHHSYYYSIETNDDEYQEF